MQNEHTSVIWTHMLHIAKHLCARLLYFMMIYHNIMYVELSRTELSTSTTRQYATNDNRTRNGPHWLKSRQYFQTSNKTNRFVYIVALFIYKYALGLPAKVLGTERPPRCCAIHPAASVQHNTSHLVATRRVSVVSLRSSRNGVRPSTQHFYAAYARARRVFATVFVAVLLFNISRHGGDYAAVC